MAGINMLHKGQKKKLCFVVSSPMTAKSFLLGHFNLLVENYSIDLVCNVYNDNNVLDDLPVDKLIPVEIKRNVSLGSDFLSLLKLYRIFQKNRYDVVCSVTPKAGLLSVLAGIMSLTPVRIHIFTGQVWVTRTGLKRSFLKIIDKAMAFLATDLLTDSPSQRDFLVKQGIVRANKINVLASGSICGVDIDRFKPSMMFCESVRRDLGIPKAAIVALFVGRLNHDKGVLDLAFAMSFAMKRYENLWLILVGPDEAGLEQEVQSICGTFDRVRLVGFSNQPEKYMAAADIFMLPSYREGFGSSVIEAAACGLPSVCSRIYGLTDAVSDGVTGLLHEPGDVADICKKLETIIENSELRNRLGANAAFRAKHEFSQKLVTEAMRAYVGDRVG